MRFEPGTTAHLFCFLTDDDGAARDATTLVVDIYDPEMLKVDDGTPTHTATGAYQYDYALPADCKKGLWKIEWIGSVPGGDFRGQEYFEVYFNTDAAPGDQDVVLETHLRSRLAELKTDPMGNGSETFFTDDQIDDILAMWAGNLDKATLEGWRWKLARYSRLIDITESGSDRKLSQKFDQAKQMVDAWRAAVDDQDKAAAAAVAGRVVGKVVNLRERRCGPFGPHLYPFNDFSDYIRIFPTHRLILPRILG